MNNSENQNYNNNYYEVGYKKPPHSTRFKPGSSGNPKGRPRSRLTEDIDMIMSEELNKTITINENGQRKKISMKRAMVKSCIKQTLEGNPKAMTSLEELKKIVKRNEDAVEYLKEHPPAPPVNEETRKDALAYMEYLAAKKREIEEQIRLKKEGQATP